MGICGSTTGELAFDDCRIPAANLLGEEGEGFKIAMRILDRSRPGVAAQALGIAQGATDYALEYAKTRETMGKPIAQHQLIQAKLADMETAREAARGLLYRFGQMVDAGVDGAELTKASAQAKLKCGDVAMGVTTEAVQILGGYGYIKEYPVERFMRDAKITQIYEGTQEVQRLVIAREMLRESRALPPRRRGLVVDLAGSFGRAAEEYELGRPGYAEAALDAVDLPPDAVVLDLAAGTGKLTRQLVPRYERVLAVEPLGGMRAVLERVVPGAEALGGTADAIPLENDAVDAVFVGEAFHWFSTAETLAEIARVLRSRRDAGDPLQPARRRLRAAAAGGVLGRLPGRGDREAAGADGPHGAVESVLPRSVRAARRGAVSEPDRARPGADHRAGGVVEHDRSPPGGRSFGAARPARRAASGRGLPASAPHRPLPHAVSLSTWTTQMSIAGSTRTSPPGGATSARRSRRSSPRTRATATTPGTSRSSAPRRSRTPGSGIRTTRHAGRRPTHATRPTATPRSPSARAPTSTPGGAVETVYDNVYVLRFAGDGRCSEFTEWFMKRP